MAARDIIYSHIHTHSERTGFDLPKLLEHYPVTVGAGGTAGGTGSRAGAEGAVRIIWGDSRSFPSTNTADV